MLVLRYLSVLLGSSLLLSACVTPPQNVPSTTIATSSAEPAALRETSAPQQAASGPVPQVIVCLKRGLQSWKIPDNYLVLRDLPGGGQSLALTNPATRRSGLTVEVQPGQPKPKVKLQENGAVVSAKWRNLIKRCAM